MQRSGFKRPVYERAPLPPPVPIQRRPASAAVPQLHSQPKSPRWVSRALLDLARGQPCLLRSPLCNHNPETTVACHAGGVANGKGMGYKTSDELTVWGCHGCNHYSDAYGGATAGQKAAVFIAGQQRQVQAWLALLEQPGTTSRDRAAMHGALERLQIRATRH